MDVPIDVAFDEACRALGEAVVRERLLTAEVQRLSRQVAELTARAAQPTA